MALSARVAQLLEQRRGFSRLSSFGTKIRVGSLSSQGASIAKKTATSELQDKINKYNDGVISNDEMLSFLNGMKNFSLLASSEKIDVQNRIRDFQDRIRVNQLEAVYKNTAPGSLDRINTASALAAYYKSKARSLYPDTPAYSDTLSKAGQWTQTAQNEQDAMEKKARAIKRANLFNKVYQAVPGSSDEALQKSQAFTELANQAAADGDTVAAAQFQSQSTAAYSDYQAIAARESTAATTAQNKAQTKALNDYINTTYNDYKDGRISGERAIANLQEADGVAAEIGSTSAQVRLNTLATGIYRDMDKGITYSADGAFGQKEKDGGGGGLLYDSETGQLVFGSLGSGEGSGKQGSSNAKAAGKAGQGASATSNQSGGGKLKSLYRLEYDYQQNIKKLYDDFDKGKINEHDLQLKLGLNAQSYSAELTNINSQLSQLDPEYLMLMGKGKQKERVGDVLKDVQSKLQDATVTFTQIANGNVIQIMETTDNNGLIKGVPQIVRRNTNEIGAKGIDYIFDSHGIAHKIKNVEETVPISDEEYRRMAEKGTVPADLQIDDNGKFYIKRKSQYVNIFDTQGDSIKYKFNPDIKQWLPANENNDAGLAAYSAQLTKQAQETISQKKTLPVVRPLNATEMVKYIDALRTELQKQDVIQKAKDSAITLVTKPVEQKVTTLPNAPQLEFGKTQSESAQLKPVAPVQNYIKPTDVVFNVGKDVKVSDTGPALMQQFDQTANQFPSSQPVTTPVPVAPQPKIQVATPPQTPLSQAGQSEQINLNIPQSAGPKDLPKPQQQFSWGDLLNKTKSAVKNLASKVWPF